MINHFIAYNKDLYIESLRFYSVYESVVDSQTKSAMQNLCSVQPILKWLIL